MRKHQNLRKATDEHTTLAQRQQFWIDMNPDAFHKLCFKQQLLSPNGGNPSNACYDMALIFYNIVHYRQIVLGSIVEGYLDRLDDLRDARILVSADDFLEARQTRGSSELADWLIYNKRLRKHLEARISKISKLCEECLDNALDGSTDGSADCASRASEYISEVNSSFPGGQPLRAMGEIISDIYEQTRGNLLSAYRGSNAEDQEGLATSLKGMETYLKPLMADMLGTRSQETQQSGSS